MGLRTGGGESATKFILRLLNLHGILLQHGQKITNPCGQTPARWQVLGAIENKSLTVSQIARRMGITRQAAQRVANLLKKEELIVMADNPDHVRSPKLELTPAGLEIVETINSKQAEWVNDIAGRLSGKDLSDAIKHLDRFKAALEETEREFFDS